MNILQLISSGGNYGAEHVVVNLSVSLEQMGCRSLLGVFLNSRNPHTEIADYARHRGLELQLISCKGRIDRSALRTIQSLIEVENIDVLHTHAYKADLYGYAAARKLHLPVVATSHLWTHRTFSIRLYEALDRWVLRRFERVVAVSDAIADTLRNVGISPNKITTIPNGIDLSALCSAQPTLAVEIGQGTKTIVGIVGRLVSQKGPDYFLQAAHTVLATFPQTLFVLIGDGPLRGNLERLARGLGIQDKVIFTGARTDMPGVYASIDILVLPSRDEGTPMALLEALAAQKPVVATRVGAVPGIIENERTGILVDPGDVSGLSAAITRLLRDPGLRRRLGENGQTLVCQQFSAGAMAQKYLALYETLVSERGAGARIGTQNPTVKDVVLENVNK